MQALWMVAGALAFALMGAVIKLQMSADYSAFELVFWRGVVGIVLIGAIMRWRGVTLASEKAGLHASRSIVGTLAMFGWFYTLGLLPLGTSMTLNYSSPLFIAIAVAAIAWWQGGTQPARGKLYLAVLAGFVGVLLIMRPTVEQQQQFALLVGIVAAVMSAAAYLQVRMLGRLGEPEWRIVFWFSVVNCVLGAIATTAATGWQPLALAALPGLAAIGVLAAIGQMCMTRAFSRGGTLLAASLQYSGVVFATLIGWLAFDESLQLAELAGIALVVASGIGATLAMPRAPAQTAAATVPDVAVAPGAMESR
ncbi:MAG TPA: DMT family transporter [Burkholderiaceae bacterium]|nr:DMT family transporter [Burkholderiaceae bacterium]